jgi:hypothetical protein
MTLGRCEPVEFRESDPYALTIHPKLPKFSRSSCRFVTAVLARFFFDLACSISACLLHLRWEVGAGSIQIFVVRLVLVVQ